MKIRTLESFVAVSAILAVTAVADDARIAAYKSQLGPVRVTQLPTETARLVAAEKTDSRAAAADAVTAAVSLKSASAPLVVGSVAKSSPQAAATAAAAAVKLQPKVAAAITRAAVSAAPSEMDAIVSALCKARPTAFYVVGVSAAQAAPKSADRVLPAITTAIPSLKPLVDRARADFAKSHRTASLAMLLKHTDNLLAALATDLNKSPEAVLAGELDSTATTRLASLAVMPPVQNPPFVGGGGTPTEITPTDTTETPPTGRVYSAP